MTQLKGAKCTRPRLGKAKPWCGLSLRNKQQPDSRDCVSFGQRVWMLLVPWLRVTDSQTPHRMRSTLLVRLFIFLPVRTIPCLPSIQRHERFSDTKIEFAHVLASLPILMPSFEKSLWFCTDPTLSDGLPLPLPLVSSFFCLFRERCAPCRMELLCQISPLLLGPYTSRPFFRHCGHCEETFLARRAPPLGLLFLPVKWARAMFRIDSSARDSFI